MAFNKLTNAEAERLAMLAEEAAEVIQIIGKILRHGYASHHPKNPKVTNRELLVAELADFDGVRDLMLDAQDGIRVPHGATTKAAKRKLLWARHQKDRT